MYEGQELHVLGIRSSGNGDLRYLSYMYVEVEGGTVSLSACFC